MSGHDFTPNPKGAKQTREALDERKPPTGPALTPAHKRIPEPGTTRGKA